MSEIRKVLKLKHFNDCIQMSYYTKYDKTTKASSNLCSNSLESERCSISRSISTIKELCLCNEFDYFFTLTFKSKKRYNICWACKKIIKSFKYYSDKAKTLNFVFKYLFVFELTKNGGVHVHGFGAGFYDLYINKYGHISSRYFDRLGFQNFTEVSKINPFYLIKYLSKKPIKEIKHRYFRSRNLKKAEISYIHANFNEFKDLCFTFRNEFAKMITVSK